MKRPASRQLPAGRRASNPAVKESVPAGGKASRSTMENRGDPHRERFEEPGNEGRGVGEEVGPAKLVEEGVEEGI